MEASKRVESILRLVELWNRDVEEFLDALDPEFEFRPDPSFPDAGTYRGDELRQWVREWAQTWADNNFEILEIIEHGQAVVLESRWHLAAPQSGGAVPVSDFSVVLWFDHDQEDRPTRMAAFFDRERALEAADATG